MHKILFIFIILSLFLSIVTPAVSAQGGGQLPSYVLLPLRGHAQQLPLDCESSAAVDVASFFGVPIREIEFFDRLPKTDNPHTGFVGDVYDSWGHLPPEGYGVYAEPIAGLLRAYGLAAEARYGLGLEGLRAELAAGHPVILWATPRMARQPVETYTTSNGQAVAVIRYEHVVTAVGYTRYAIYVVDSASGYRWAYSNQALLAAWGKLRQMSVVVYGRAGTAEANFTTPPPDDATIVFDNPRPESRVQVPLEIRGTVNKAAFDRYEVWVASGRDPAVWRWVSGPHLSPVAGGLLTPEQLNHLTPGVYTLRVVVYSRDGHRSEGRTTFYVWSGR